MQARSHEIQAAPWATEVQDTDPLRNTRGFLVREREERREKRERRDTNNPTHKLTFQSMMKFTCFYSSLSLSISPLSVLR